ncbi:Cof-type HAD-IIB family hydrolase [Alkalicoccus chagannorensis]|uniref:Cof-type HAD-IIB family hydrolase n=1 Tax=Alkalicoccus chagannorensis TaxID=427072 RepID=UPI000416C204|nr:Cof-type HAD-IIB family hydrolase [Alkalicoccus chagannorensis]
MNHDIRLIVLDMDGTTLNSSHQISRSNTLAVHEASEAGYEMMIATGRSLPAVAHFAEELKMKDWIITGNGSEIWELSGPELKHRQLLNAALVEKMNQIKVKHGARHWAASVDKVWKNEMPEDIQSRQWLKFGYDLDDTAVRDQILHLLHQEDELEVSNSSPLNIEVNAAGVHKAAAIEKVLEDRGWGFHQVMALGDSLNDLTMIREAGVGVAMGNAQEEVKQEADFVTADFEADGVAEALRHLGIIKK